MALIVAIFMAAIALSSRDAESSVRKACVFLDTGRFAYDQESNAPVFLIDSCDGEGSHKFILVKKKPVRL